MNRRERSSMEKITGRCLEPLCALGVDHLPLDRYELDRTITFACSRIRVHSVSPRNYHTMAYFWRTVRRRSLGGGERGRAIAGIA